LKSELISTDSSRFERIDNQVPGGGKNRGVSLLLPERDVKIPSGFLERN